MRSHLVLEDAKIENVSEDTFKAVAETLRTSTFLKVYEDGKKISKVIELAKPDEVIKQLEVKTIVTSPLEYCVKVELLWLCFVLGKEDWSVTRSVLYFKQIHHQCGLHKYKMKDQEGSPDGQFSVKMYASNILKQVKVIFSMVV